MKKFAIVSVYNKSGLIPFVKGLVDYGLNILSTGGTAKFLMENGINVVSVGEYTGQPEIMEGRVKTLHPRIHAGILARRELDEDLQQLAEAGGELIDMVVVNLYPFVEKVRELEKQGQSNHDSLVEFIDIGGPTMIRAAAKNCHNVTAVCDPTDYQRILDELKSDGEVSLATRTELAARVFMTMSAYDGEIARYFSLGEKLLDEDGRRHLLAPAEACVFAKELVLRYGENPHQQGALYRQVSAGTESFRPSWTKLQGKEISYNNLLDMQAALQLFLELRNGALGKHASVVIKHLNPCGAAVRDTALEAFCEARDCDPLSAFGGIVVLSGVVDQPLAESVLEGFVEVVLAEKYTDDALQTFARKKNIRVIECNFLEFEQAYATDRWLLRDFAADVLLQESDNSLVPVREAKVVTNKQPSDSVLGDLEFAWKLCKHVKSNTIVIVKDLKAIGVGAGQMSRVDAAKIAIQRAREHEHELDGSAAGSDAFFPFPDALEVLNDAGVAAVVQPGGSIKDKDVIESANHRQVVMVLTGERHFRH